MDILAKLDDVVMKGANASVKAYNWTTGGTKADLANNMLSVAPVSYLIGTLPQISILPEITPIILAISSLFFMNSHKMQLYNKKVNELEKKAANNDILNILVVDAKRKSKIVGYAFGGVSTFPLIQTYSHSYPDNFLWSGLSSDVLLRSGSSFVMATDYLPPRKNCVKRGLDALEKKIAEYQSEPKGVPVPSPV